jgi:hypothetical protein
MHKNKSTFTTERLPLAAYLHAGKLLSFLRCEPGATGKVAFLFDDPAGAAPQLEYEYENGAACSAAALFASQKYLRRKIDQTLATEIRRDAHRSYPRS